MNSPEQRSSPPERSQFDIEFKFLVKEGRDIIDSYIDGSEPVNEDTLRMITAMLKKTVSSDEFAAIPDKGTGSKDPRQIEKQVLAKLYLKIMEFDRERGVEPMLESDVASEDGEEEVLELPADDVHLDEEDEVKTVAEDAIEDEEELVADDDLMEAGGTNPGIDVSNWDRNHKMIKTLDERNKGKAPPPIPLEERKRRAS